MPWEIKVKNCFGLEADKVFCAENQQLGYENQIRNFCVCFPTIHYTHIRMWRKKLFIFHVTKVFLVKRYTKQLFASELVANFLCTTKKQIRIMAWSGHIIVSFWWKLVKRTMFNENTSNKLTSDGISHPPNWLIKDLREFIVKRKCI